MGGSGLDQVVRRHLGPSPSSGFLISCLAPPPGRSSLRSGQMAASRSRLTFILSHLSGKSDSLPQLQQKSQKEALWTPGHLPMARKMHSSDVFTFWSSAPPRAWVQGWEVPGGKSRSCRQGHGKTGQAGQADLRWLLQPTAKKWLKTTHTYYLTVWSPEILKSRCQGCSFWSL